MLVGLKNLRTTAPKAAVLDSWFSEEPVSEAQKSYTAAHDLFDSIHIRKSLKSVARHENSVPQMPRCTPPSCPPLHGGVAPASPSQTLHNILDSQSRSSSYLTQIGLLEKFTAQECFVDISMMPDGGVSAALRSVDGFRRTVVCRKDGTSGQRITSPSGAEIIRFNNNGEPLFPSELKRQPVLAIN